MAEDLVAELADGDQLLSALGVSLSGLRIPGRLNELFLGGSCLI